MRIAEPSDPKTEGNFRQFQEAALTALFKWDQPRSASIVTAMSSDAEEYLRASFQRGDTYNAGKVEYHQGAGFDIGVIWTQADRTLVIASQTAE